MGDVISAAVGVGLWSPMLPSHPCCVGNQNDLRVFNIVVIVIGAGSIIIMALWCEVLWDLRCPVVDRVFTEGHSFLGDTFLDLSCVWDEAHPQIYFGALSVVCLYAC